MSKSPKINETSDEEVEEMLVYVDIEPTSLSESQIKESERLKMMGNDKKVLLQLNNRFFEGDFDFSIGTHVFFEKDESVPIDPLYSQCDVFYKYKAKTAKVLKMTRVQLREHSDNNESTTEKDREEVLDITRTYEQSLNLFLPPGKKAPRKIFQEEEISEKLLIINPKDETNEL